MTGPEVLDVSRDAIFTLVVVSSPVMLVGLAVGLAISLLQALTQIQEMTLAFVPKILAIFISLLVAAIYGGENARRNVADRGTHCQRLGVKQCGSTSHSCRRWRPHFC
jgi:flagellar biosynthetic protein FliQ